MINFFAFPILGQTQSYTEIAGDLIIGAPGWVIPAAILGLGCTVLVVWNYATGKRDKWAMIGAALKLTAIALMAVCMIQPMRSGRRPRPRANLLPVLVDDSRSMDVASLSESETWHQRIKNAIGKDDEWVARFSQTFDFRTYAFDTRLREISSPDDLIAQGRVSRLSHSVSELSQRFKDRPVAGLLLMTDGNETQRESQIADWSTLGFPVFPVVPESNRRVHDLSLVETSVGQTNFETAPVTVSIKFDAMGMSGRNVILQLRDQETGLAVAEKTETLRDDGEIHAATFRFRPPRPGIQFYRLVVFSEADRERFADASLSDSSKNSGAADDISAEEGQGTPEAAGSSETTLVNNARFIAVDRDAGPYRILYLAGRPNWEFKFLRRSLDQDAEVQLVGLIRIAKEEPKFSFRDRGISESNPLFEGVDDESAAAEQYDEPVIIRLGVKESDELSKGFPKTSEELFGYHAIIVDDIEPEFFTQDQMLLIRKFVSARGGGLMFLGGKEAFGGKKFADSPLGALSPFYETRDGQHSPSDFEFALSREGMLQPWLRLRETETAETQRLREMPAFRTVNAVGPLKPGALALAQLSPGDKDVIPALAVQRFGKGRCVGMPIADFWRWSMHRFDKSRDDPEQAWRQIARWLVSEVPKRVEVKVDDRQDSDGSVILKVYARDESFLAIDNATVNITVTPPAGGPLEIRAEQIGDVPGVYQAQYWPRIPGPYKADIRVLDVDQSEVGNVSAGWTTQVGGSEFDALTINRSLLEKIAEDSGGQVLTESQLPSFIDRLPSEKVPVTETWVYPIWHRPWIMVLALMCLCTEWGIRRWRGMV